MSGRRSTVIVVNLLEKRDRKRCERFCFSAFCNDRQPRPREREDQRRHPRAGNRDVRADAARRCLAAQLLADRARRAEQPIQPADVDRYQIVVMPLVAGGELLGNRDEPARRRRRRRPREWRLIDARV
jgi:hypothetical protein